MVLTLLLVAGTILSVVGVVRRGNRRTPTSQAAASSGAPATEDRFSEASGRAGSQASRPSRRLERLLVAAAIAVVPLVAWQVWTVWEYWTVTPTHDALIGTWRGDNGATIVFTSDGRFSGQVGGDPSAAPEGGTWYIGKEPLEGDSTGVVFSFSRGYTSELLARGSRSSPTLFYYIGDPDENRRYEFKKQQ
jgi:hypothetical protein